VKLTTVTCARRSVLYKLWESSWRDDAVVLDVATDTYAEPSRIRKIHHHGEFFDVEGPSFVEPSPQKVSPGRFAFTSTVVC
jgi:alkanesulfonate monooxygenase SsuD/methylene tetrahydromethanopterin reductase-like flavin-dependent oxidoreductase (luciferase family)